MEGASARYLAMAIGLGPSLFSLVLGRPLPESWPSSPIWLFPFNGDQAAALAARCMTGDTRLVLTPASSRATDIVGAKVCYAMKPRPAGRVVHDAVLRTIGFTLAGDERLLSLMSHPTF